VGARPEAIDAYLRTLPPPEFGCVDCRADTQELGDLYMLVDALWHGAVPRRGGPALRRLRRGGSRPDSGLDDYKRGGRLPGSCAIPAPSNHRTGALPRTFAD